MGKKRNTAKTGDKAIYKRNAQLREEASQKSKTKKYDENMYDKVDQFHNDEDENFLQLDRDHGNRSDDDSDSNDGEEAVMDLGVGGDSSDDDDDDDDSSGDDGSQGKSPLLRQAARGTTSTDSSSDDNKSDDDDQDEDDEEEIEDVRNWGRKKSTYYHGDTADLEIGQDEEDAFLEEEAAKEVQAARLEDMDEEDFMLSDDDDDDDDEDDDDEQPKGKKAKKSNIIAKENSNTSNISSIRDVSKLSSKDRRKLIEKQHPGLLQILSHFSEAVQDLTDRTTVATGALFDGDDSETAEAVGATPLGKKYLLTKALIQSSTALNLAMFLLLKSEESSALKDNYNDSSLMDTGATSLIQFHPVMKRLQEFNVLDQKLKSKVEDKVEGLNDQLENLIKASKLMESMEDGPGSDDDSVRSSDNDEIEVNENISANVAAVDDASSSSDSEEPLDGEAMAKFAAQNAKFGLRPNEVSQDNMMKPERKRRRRPAPTSDFPLVGDWYPQDQRHSTGSQLHTHTHNKGAARYLSSALNTIEQRAASKKKKRVASSEELVEHKEIDDDVRRGLELMESELGKASDEEGNVEEMDDGDDLHSDGDGGDDDFYAAITKKSKSKKAFKKSLYKVAPKYPRLEAEVEGERAVSRAIMKNRGLVAHKNKLNRNPRVKKREQYRKALIKRKGTVREVRTEEGHRYGGEETGIKKGISRSRKLGT